MTTRTTGATDQELMRALIVGTRVLMRELEARVEATESDTITLSVDLAALERSVSRLADSLDGLAVSQDGLRELVSMMTDAHTLMATRVARIEDSLKPDW